MQAAGAGFAVLFRGGGGSAVDSVVPSMLTSLTNDSKQAPQALEGLRVILGVRPQTLGMMLPRLLKPHLTPTSMRALASLAEVAGNSRCLSVDLCHTEACSRNVERCRALFNRHFDCPMINIQAAAFDYANMVIAHSGPLKLGNCLLGPS